MGREPAGDTHDARGGRSVAGRIARIVIRCLLGDLKDGVVDAPTASDSERVMISFFIELLCIGEDLT